MTRTTKIEFCGLNLKIEFDYEPEEPWRAAQVDITEVWAAIPEELFSILEDQFEEACWSELEKELSANAEAQARDREEHTQTIIEMKRDQERENS